MTEQPQTPAEAARAEAEAEFGALLKKIPAAVKKGTENALNAMDVYNAKFAECMNNSHPQEAEFRKKLIEIMNSPVDPEGKIREQANHKINELFSKESIEQMDPQMAEFIRKNPLIANMFREQFAQTDMEIPPHIKDRLFEAIASQSDPVLRAQLCGQIHSPNGKTR